MFCASTIYEQSKVMIVDLEQVEILDDPKPWHLNVRL